MELAASQHFSTPEDRRKSVELGIVVALGVPTALATIVLWAAVALEWRSDSSNELNEFVSIPAGLWVGTVLASTATLVLVLLAFAIWTTGLHEDQQPLDREPTDASLTTREAVVAETEVELTLITPSRALPDDRQQPVRQQAPTRSTSRRIALVAGLFVLIVVGITRTTK